MTSSDFFAKLTLNHPFITVMRYSNQDYVGIVQNRDDIVTTIYDYGAISDIDMKKRFLELGDIWWGESNREIPINLFLKSDWLPFKQCLKTFSNKNLSIIHGPVVSITNLAKKRIKRRSITLVKRVI